MRITTDVPRPADDEVGEQSVPADFDAFVTAHEAGVRTACLELTDNEQLATPLARDLLVAVALRWRWYGRRPATQVRAAAYLNRLLRKEARSWARRQPDTAYDVAGAAVDQAPTERVPDHSARLAEQIWRRASATRRKRRVIAAAVVVMLGLLWIAGPQVLPEPARDPATLEVVPASVLVLPPFAELGDLAPLLTMLPLEITVDGAGDPDLADQPIPRALGVFRSGNGPLVLLAPDGSTRVVTDPLILGSRALSTSLSPDGTRVAFTVDEGLVLLDLGTAAPRLISVPLRASESPSLVWRSATTALVPGREGAVEVNVDTGEVSPRPGPDGFDVLNNPGDPSGLLIELLLPSVETNNPRFRIWGTPPDRAVPQPSVGQPTPTPSAAARAYVDRNIGGPVWLNEWSGIAASAPTMQSRCCDPMPGTTAAPAPAPRANAATPGRGWPPPARATICLSAAA